MSGYVTGTVYDKINQDQFLFTAQTFTLSINLPAEHCFADPDSPVGPVGEVILIYVSSTFHAEPDFYDKRVCELTPGIVA